MGVYHITYTRGLRQVCLYFDGGCNFSCHGCITDYHPEDCHLKKIRHIKNKALSKEEVVLRLKPLSFTRVIFLGKEPTMDADFLPLAKMLKEKFKSFNTLITNGYNFMQDAPTDEVCVSIKAISKEVFNGFTGSSNPGKVLRNFERYAKTPRLKVRAESVFIPGCIDTDEIEKISRLVAKVDPSIPYRIDAYMPQHKDKFRRPTEKEMAGAKRVAEKHLRNVSVLKHGMKVRHKVERVY